MIVVKLYVMTEESKAKLWDSITYFATTTAIILATKLPLFPIGVIRGLCYNKLCNGLLMDII
jgi:hypothetical protein